MKAAGISDIKQELKTLSQSELLEVCLRLARTKKDNKELLTYLLFEAHDVDGYISQLKNEIDEGLSIVNKNNLYLLKKQLRKLLSMINKRLKYIASKAAEVEVLLHFCNALRVKEVPYRRTTALINIYQAQLKKITTAIASLEDDLQYDFNRQLEALR